jgi:hypothetical protein
MTKHLRHPQPVEHLESRLLLATQPYDWRNVAIKGDGFIDGIVYSPAQPDLVYIHTDMGGAYRWDQFAGKWTPLNDWSRWDDWPAQNLGVEAMAVDPTDAGRVYMAAGTYFSPAAMLRSTDAGHTWLRTDVSGIHPNGNGNGRNGGQRMFVDPNLTSTIYYGTRRDGLWKSADFGATWNRVTSFPVTGDASGTAQDVGIDWVIVDKSSGTSGSASQTIYAGVSTTAANKIYRSTNGGATWTAIAGQPTTAAWFPIRAALTPDGGTMYLTYSNNVGPNGATAGNVYKVTSPASATPTWATLATPTLSGGGGWSGVDIDPSNANNVVISTLDWWAGPDDIFRSTNGGSTWTRLFINSHRDDSSAPFASSLTPHWLGDVEIDPFNPNVAMVTTGYGLYRTTDLTNGGAGGAVHWSFFDDGFEQSAVTELVSPNTGSAHLFSSIGDRDGFRHDDFSVSPASGRFGQSQGRMMGTSEDIDVAWTDSNSVVRVGDTSPYAQYSNDGGTTWNWFGVAPSGTSSGGHVALSADGTKAAWDPGGGPLRYATRTGTTWSAWTAPTWPGTAPGDTIVVADLVNAQTFYAYRAGTVFISTNGGATWTQQTTTAPTTGSWIRAVPGNAGHLLMSTDRNNNGLWRSTNGGANWIRINPGAVTIALGVGVGAAAPGQSYPAIYVFGTVNGLTGFHRSDDQGATWTRINDDAHQFGWVTVIQGDPRVYGRLYVGANGRGVLYGDIDQTAPTVTASDFQYQTGPNKLTFTFSESVVDQLTAGDVTISRAGGGTVTPTGYTYNTATNIATFTLVAPLPDGDYTATITAVGVKDNAGNALAGDYVMPFFVFAGDANHDRTVDLTDFTFLASNFNGTNKTFGEGDFNYDGKVDLTDFTILASKFNMMLGSSTTSSLATGAKTVVAQATTPAITPLATSLASSRPFSVQSVQPLTDRDPTDAIDALLQ